MKKARDLLSHHAFNTEPGKGMSQDYNKPLIIPAWSDSFEAISGGSSGSSSGGRQNLEMWKHQFIVECENKNVQILNIKFGEAEVKGHSFPA